MTAFYLFSSIAAALAGSYWINFLYGQPNAPLSFPDKIHGKKVFRKIFIASALFAAMTFCSKLPILQAAYLVTAIFFLSLIIVTDFEQYIIFDKILLPFTIIGALFTIILELPIFTHLISALIGGVIFFALMTITKGGIGGGDVKLVAAIGLWIGEGLSFVVLTAAILGGLAAIILLVTGFKKRTDFFAYGPYFCIATAAYLFNLL